MNYIKRLWAALFGSYAERGAYARKGDDGKGLGGGKGGRAYASGKGSRAIGGGGGNAETTNVLTD